MNLSDLSEVLRERAGEPVDLPPESRLAAIRNRVVARRRRRLMVAVSGLVVLLLAGVVYSTAWQGRTAPPADSRTIEGFPEYASGARVIAAGSGALPHRTLTVRFVPASLDLTVFTRCDNPGRQLMVRLEVNGGPLSPGGTCGGGHGFPEQAWTDGGVRVGAPAEVTLTVIGGQSPEGDLLPIPDSGAFAMAIGEAVPPDEYPYPPRPATLDSLDDVGLPGTSGELRADPADPNRPQQLSLTWPGPLELQAVINTPGRLRILVDDVEVLSLDGWAYYPQGASTSDDLWPELVGLRLAPGQLVTIRVLPERASGDWKVTLHPPW
ncbi:MAG TPA: hypothetical protein VFV67_00885 [Actinophytocola sp.]|uniref:hypothetical protein n=1 Tax=Actinophytocola sp. TaxID=1872138 RepID=UPI002DB70981|nr:hypothetical protein [Actinophytocola sp.]HEU5469178.1 hypothetical protein [Actinophytocola sp.]